jgi:hypothetical protein
VKRRNARADRNRDAVPLQFRQRFGERDVRPRGARRWDPFGMRLHPMGDDVSRRAKVDRTGVQAV